MKVLLIDAFPMVRAALTGLIDQQFPGAEVQGVDSVAAARAALDRALPDLVLLDLRIDGGLDFLVEVHHDRLLLPIAVISGSEETHDAVQALGAGASGYVPERSDLSTLAEALHLVLAGGIYVPPLRQDADAPPGAVVVPMPPDWGDLPLTPRQKNVLKLLTQGLSNKLIARELGLSVETVKDHVAAVLRALGVTSRTQAVVVATRNSRG